MKVPRHSKKKKRKPPGPKTEIGGERMNFFPGDSLDKIVRLNDLYKEAGIKRITKSFVLRESARAWLRAEIKRVKLALKGELHAKKRN